MYISKADIFQIILTHGIKCNARILFTLTTVYIPGYIWMVDRLCYHRCPDVIKADVTDKRFCGILRSIVIIVADSTESDTNWTGNIPHDNIGEGKVFDVGSACTDLDRATIGFVDQAIGNSNI